MKRRLPSWTAALLAALAAFGPSAPARGAPGGDAEGAKRLFAEGREALARGDHEAACARFRSSLALAEVANTLFNVAQCEEREGKLRDALASWQRGIALLGAGDERLAVAKARAAALDGKVPRIMLLLGAGMPDEVRVSVDGVVAPRAEWAAPLPLNLGAHTIDVEARGRRPQRFVVSLGEGDRKDVAITAGPIVREERPAPGPRRPPPPSAQGSERRTVGFVVGGIGLAGLAVAGITGALILEQDGRIHEACRDKVCSPAGRALIDGSRPVFIANAVSWGVGIAGAGVGAFLLLTGGGGDQKRAALAPFVLPGGGGAAVAGRF